ncbi:hypothetical protein KIN20_000134 [Parelaphostrongylus tenuis]|uniref:Uncharacterized protein n=1 Tax=Parelaphostrongylus tenuis TaxID=148309 RepID=A0AAD5MK73_PARTN|nr:hypothetical protein KIN20_000134 [Parelaphostrongylus tenuis]
MQVLDSSRRTSSRWSQMNQSTVSITSCVAESPKEAVHYLEKCMAIEPYHAEANSMYASLLMNEIGPRELTEDEYEKLKKHVSIAMSTFDNHVDFPVLMGVFRLREVLIAKKEASKILVT